MSAAGRTAAEEHKAAKERVAKLEKEFDDLNKEIVNNHGSVKALGEECKHETNKTTGKLNILRRKYNNVSADLRQARKDLDKAKSAAEKEALETKMKNRPCDRCGRLPDGPMCSACGPANDYKQFVEKPGLDDKEAIDDQVEGKPFWCGGPLDTVNRMPWHVAVAECLPGQRMVLLPGRYEWNELTVDLEERLDLLIDGAAPWAPGEVITFIQKGQEAKEEAHQKKSVMQVMEENAQKAEASKATSIVISDKGVSIDGGAPVPREVVSAAIDVIQGKKTKVVQQDLHGRELKLPAGVTEEKVVSRKRVYEDGFYKVSISEDDLLEFNGKFIENKRKIVGAKLRVNPTDDDDFDPDDLPEEIDRMIKVLNIASINLQSELLARGRC